MCSMGLAGEDCCCGIQVAAEPMGCCATSEHDSAPAEEPRWQAADTDCECARAPERSPLQFPEVADSTESQWPLFACFEIEVALQPQPRPPVAFRAPRVWPPGKERALSVLFQVFRL
jgi:hypothetical protein